ncbi:MAG TPA: hypothetical protein PK453_28855, partial [Leptospiraceae bacterium]|nr:hypothetical protein [Leptospiraceae bacterium]
MNTFQGDVMKIHYNKIKIEFLFLILRLILIIPIYFFILPISAEEQKRTAPEKAEEKKDFQKFKYFSFSPGVNLQSADFVVKNGGRSADMTGKDGIISYSLDLKSRDFQISENSGIALFLYNGSIHLDKQYVSDPFSGSLSSSSGSSKKVMDLGTDVNIRTSSFIPSVYFGKKDYASWRLGIGAGYANMNVTGTVGFEDPQEYAFLAFRGNRQNLLNAMTYKYFNSGVIDPNNSDSVLNYLYLNLNQPGSLEGLAAYMGAKGLLKFSSSDVVNYMLFKSAFGDILSPSELLAFAVLSRTNVSHRKTNAPAFKLYLEVPLHSNLLLRVSYGGPLYRENRYQYSP